VRLERDVLLILLDDDGTDTEDAIAESDL
jgi:hypothetical protein